MSQDLFAAFGDAGSVSADSSLHEPKTTNNRFSPSELLQAKPNVIASDQPELKDDDDFGDFEDASNDHETMAISQSPAPDATKRTEVAHSVSDEDSDAITYDVRVGKHPFADHMDFLFSGGNAEYDAGEDDLEDLSRNPEAAMEFSKRMLASRTAGRSNPSDVPPRDEQHERTRAAASQRSSNKLKKKSGYVPAKDPNILFDADEAIQEGFDDSDTDDFGDFEGESVPQIQIKKPDIPRPKRFAVLPELDVPTMDDARERMSPTDLASGQVLTPLQSRLQPYSRQDQIVNLDNDDDAWDDFDVAEPSQPSNATTPMVSVPSTAICPQSQSATKSTVEESVPPTNVPPPAMLLSVFPSLIASARDALLDPISRLNAAQRQQLLMHPASTQLLRNYSDTAITLARIIAGRKLRWKRDQYLAQGMRIGPAAAGGKSGMKLTGLDKAESAKEDREVLDAVRLWKAQTGKLRAAVTTANSNKASKIAAVIDIAEQMPVKTLKAIDGGFVAPHPCAICGLKREERVAKVDTDVNDSFGEWWLSSLSMHATCRRFWDENKSRLKFT